MPVLTNAQLDEYLDLIMDAFFVAARLHRANPCQDGTCGFEDLRDRIVKRFDRTGDLFA